MKYNMVKFVSAIVALFVMFCAPAQAAITWDFTGVTGELGGLGTALVTAIGVAIAAGLVVFGVKRSVGVILGVISKLLGR